MKRRSTDPIGNKVITTWRVRCQAEQRDVEVKVSITARRKPGHDDGEIIFIAEAALAGGARVREESADLFALRRNVTALVADSKPLTWESKLVVTMRTTLPHLMGDGDAGAGLMCTYEPIQLAKAGGEELSRRFEGGAIERRWPNAGELKGDWGDGDARSVSIIDDTPENRAALDHIVSGIEQVSARLRELMSPTNIAAAIAAASAGLPLLADQSASEGKA